MGGPSSFAVMLEDSDNNEPLAKENAEPNVVSSAVNTETEATAGSQNDFMGE